VEYDQPRFATSDEVANWSTMLREGGGQISTSKGKKRARKGDDRVDEDGRPSKILRNAS
jgi:hypothetical protein